MLEAKAEHIIKAQRYQVTLDQEAEAHRIQSEISVAQNARVSAMLDRVLTQFSNNDSIYCFDRIELDLGRISKTNFENLLVAGIEEELIRFLSAAIREDGTLRTGKMIVLNDRKLEQFKYFLLNGHFNWQAGASRSPAGLLKSLAAENQAGLVDLLKEYGKNAAVRKRLIYQFDEEPLERIVEVVAKTESTYIIAYKRSIIEQQRKHHLVETELMTFRNAVWEVILAYLFVETNSYYNRKNFLHFLIQKIAQKYRLTYAALLDVLVKGVDLEQKGGNQLEFKKIILELRTEEQIKRTDKIPVVANDQDSPRYWISEIDHYMRTGIFHPGNPWRSRLFFNRKMDELIENSQHALIRVADEWIRSPEKITRLLILIDDPVLNGLTGIMETNSIRSGNDFFSNLDKHRTRLSATSRAVWIQLQQKKGRLLFITIRAGVEYTDVVPALLETMCQEFGSRAEGLMLLLEELRDHLPAKQQKQIDRFLSGKASIRKDQPLMAKKHLDQFAASVLEFTKTAEAGLWIDWLGIRLEEWSKLTGLKRQEILNALRKKLAQRMAPPRVLTLFEQAGPGKPAKQGKASSVPDYSPLILQALEEVLIQNISAELLFSEWVKEVLELLQKKAKLYRIPLDGLMKALMVHIAGKTEMQDVYKQLKRLQASSFYSEFLQQLTQDEADPERANKVEYALLEGMLPWWDATYMADDFNADFSLIWKTASGRTKLIKLLLKSERKKAWLHMLNPTNLAKVWKELDRSSSGSNGRLAERIDYLLINQLLPAGIITRQQYRQLSERFQEIFLERKSVSATEEAILKGFTKWLGITGVLHYKSMEYLVAELVPAKKVLKMKPQAASMTSVKQFLDRHPLSNQWENRPLRVQLERMLQAAPDELNHLLNREELRISLIAQLEEKELQEFIHRRLNANQQRFFTESLTVIEAVVGIISWKESEALKKRFYQLLLLRWSAGGFSSWSESDWGELFLRSLEQTLGKNKSREVLVKTGSRLLARRGNDAERGLVLLEQLHLIIRHDETEAASKEKKEDRDYRKLGEETPREFLDPIFVSHAGLIILAPYLGMLFERCGLMQGGEFIDAESREKGVHLLHYAATGTTGSGEHEQVVGKVLCGLGISDPVDRQVVLSEQDQDTVNGMLTAITQQWQPLNGTSIEGLQVSFLQREGKLEEEEEQYFMKVEQKAFDMLLDQISWNITKIKLSWMKKVLIIEWR
ncbi:MAG: hypothetical protein KDD41_03735 [Flavobacteriales bacterium]|nr:hypothetical protein [Flavobacteriales bacterium]